MIAPLLERASRRAECADAVEKTDETLTLQFEAGQLRSAGRALERGVNLRVVADGRIGFAGTTGDDPDQVLEAAMDSARVGEAGRLELPPPDVLPDVLTSVPRAASADLDTLRDIGSAVADRLAADGCQVNVTVERSVGEVRVANTRGVEALYSVSGVSVSAEIVRVIGDDIVIIGDYRSGADLPALGDLERMVEQMRQRLAWSGTAAEAPEGRHPVCFAPTALPALLLPVQLACIGKTVMQGSSPLAGRIGDHRFDSAFSLVDDPLAEGRSGSRPLDDEGVVSRRFPLVEGGVVCGFIYDLESATRAGVSPTGHGRRTTFGKPQPAYTNLVVSPGSLAFEALLAQVDDGLLVDELLGVGQGNVIGGAFSHPVALAWRVIKGEVAGRVTGTQVAGNALDLLDRLRGVGRDVEWRGSQAAPAMVVDGVAVVGR
jgi:PmbA protein